MAAFQCKHRRIFLVFTHATPTIAHLLSGQPLKQILRAPYFEMAIAKIITTGCLAQQALSAHNQS
jgi:C4-dicarboxylate transporter